MIITIIIVSIVTVVLLITTLKKPGAISSNAAISMDLIKSKSTLLLDVRSPEEFKNGHIKDAVNIPVSELMGRIHEISSFKEQDVLVYCLSGGRSSAASQILKQQGFVKVHNLQGGITSWMNAGNPIVK
jgi:rhodanese-related sulfurtransferase